MEDITEVLEVTVYDENRRTKHDFLGKVKLQPPTTRSTLYIFYTDLVNIKFNIFYLSGSYSSTKDTKRRKEMVQTKGEKHQEGCSRPSS